MKNKRCRMFLFFIPPIVLGFVALLALVVFGLWNGVLTDVLAVKPVTYWQALGIVVLAKILFGGFPGARGGGMGPSMRRRMMMKRWESLTPEQRAAMREEMRRRFGDWPRPPWCEGSAGEEGSGSGGGADPAGSAGAGGGVKPGSD